MDYRPGFTLSFCPILKKIKVANLQETMGGNKKITLTAYHFSMARILDQIGVEVLLVGD